MPISQSAQSLNILDSRRDFHTQYFSSNSYKVILIRFCAVCVSILATCVPSFHYAQYSKCLRICSYMYLNNEPFREIIGITIPECSLLLSIHCVQLNTDS